MNDDREKLIAGLRRVATVLEEYEFEDHASEAAGLMNSAADALAAPAPVDEAKLAETIFEACVEWHDRRDGDYVRRSTFVARAVRECLESS